MNLKGLEPDIEYQYHRSLIEDLIEDYENDKNSVNKTYTLLLTSVHAFELIYVLFKLKLLKESKREYKDFEDALNANFIKEHHSNRYRGLNSRLRYVSKKGDGKLVTEITKSQQYRNSICHDIDFVMTAVTEDVAVEDILTNTKEILKWFDILYLKYTKKEDVK